MSNSNVQQWNAALYDSKHKFVSELATETVELLSPKAGERILDVGCGTGTFDSRNCQFWRGSFRY